MWRWSLPAQVDLNQVARHSRGSSSLGDNWFLIVAVVGIALLWVALYYWDKIRKQLTGTPQSPKALFVELCKAHELTRTERALLARAAEQQGLKQPAMVFIDPEVLAEMVRSAGPEADAYRELAVKLFDPDDEGDPSGSREADDDADAASRVPTEPSAEGRS